MQKNVTELTQRLLRSLDSNYNVIDMPAVIEIISLLENVAITKELLETTRLGKHVNELRRKSTNDSLTKRAKELVKKWRSMVLPEQNGQIKAAIPSEQEDVNLNQLKVKKRAAKETLAFDTTTNLKRAKLNGGITELDLSDNSNSSFKDVINLTSVKAEPKRDVILINSDSNSSMPEGKFDPHVEQQMPKKRGRKKGSKNHKNLLDEAESSFTSKLAVSRGNSKVKTTQELLASLQNKAAANPVVGAGLSKSKEDLNERAAKLTERVSIIDQKLNTNANRFKNSQRKSKIHLSERSHVIESGSVINDKTFLHNSSAEEDVIVVDEPDQLNSEVGEEEDDNDEKHETDGVVDNHEVVKSLSREDALALLPPIDKSVLLPSEEEEISRCTCFLKENKPQDFSVGDEEEAEAAEKQRFEFIEDHECLASGYLANKYQLSEVTNDRVQQLHETCIPNVTGNFSRGDPKPPAPLLDNGLYVNVVPNVNNESLAKQDIKTNFSSENFKKYSISEEETIECTEERTGGDGGGSGAAADDKPEGSASEDIFREWHEVVETPSYNGEILKILPYVIID